ncbi:MAG: hypothetical protein QOF72_1844 [Blastocatellia bacterium]|jgi:hypothetical protein|nr:hypothetical protein [Blastocatellia bacterium]
MIAENSYKALIALALILSVSFILPQRTQACGPFFTDAIFVYSKHPDLPLESFAGGKLGVLQTKWARSYLVAAYRNLAGNRFSESEAKGIKGVWDDRLNLSWESNDDQWVKKWNEARKQVPGISAPAEIKVYRNREKPHEYESFLNCQQDAFENAEATLSERIKKFGADSAAMRDWIGAQDKVFANCGEGKLIPEAARPDQDSLIRADRAYQIAAANFYATNFDEAKQQFDSIVLDKSSPWRDKAGYLAARSLLRKGSLAEKEEDGRPSLAEAETRLNAVLKDNSATASHHASKKLLNLVRLRLHPEEKLHELAHSLIKRDASADFKQDVWDYTALLDKFLGDGEESDKPVRPAGLNSDELTDWVLAFEDSSPAAATHSLAQWEKSKSLPWLVAAISKANGQQPKAGALLSAAAIVDHTSPAFPSLAFHSVRLLTESNRGGEARATLDKILAADRQQLPPSTLNLLLAQRTTLAQNLAEFLRAAQRVPAGFSDDSDGREIPEEESSVKETTKGSAVFFDLDGANAFNKAMPVALIKDAASSKALAPNLQRDVAQAAFIRAALLDDRATADQAAALLQGMYPQLKEFLGAYQKAATPDARRFSAVYMSLKFPGLRPYVSAGTGRTTALEEVDSYRDNYWCAEAPTPQSGPPSQDVEEGKAKAKLIPIPEFLKLSQTVAATQSGALQALGTAPDYFCRIAIAWTEKNPADPRAPEALHLAVRSTRYGCTDEQTGRWSKAAYDLLHRRYPNTTWAKNTKYWFKG